MALLLTYQQEDNLRKDLENLTKTRSQYSNTNFLNRIL